ncbi:MAG: hypothetical protein DI598_15400 [Pseudopedobacter saltans]|uniref:Outer membrane protein beta-barrel domain-containing protein n=1 Tax=Pseudopedobacter saltans TaxID=151895 RepID=A0A2W5GP10_9SPHI|nr:MAG: hypothetical protein DI598_15400 [Pseudopedobacter saltans]
MASGEKAVRLPSEGEMFGNDVENEVANYNLCPEKSTNANLGFNIGPYVFHKHSISVNSSMFYRDVKDMIRRAVSADSRDVASFENLNSVMTYGFDAEILYKYSNLVQFNFNVSKFNALFNTEYDASGARYSYYKEQIRNEPSFKFSSGLTYFWNDAIKKKARASIYYNTNYVGRFLRDWAGIGGTGLNWIPTQFVHDLGIAYTLPNRKTTIALDAKNILNTQIFDNFRIQKPGRAFYAKITYAIF